MKWRQNATLLGLLVCAHPATALYSWQDGQSQGDARILLRGFVIASQKPANPVLYQERDEQALGGLARVITRSNHRQNWQFEFNAYQTYIEKSLLGEQGSLVTVTDVERSDALDWRVSDEEYAHFTIDRLNTRWSSGRIDISLGRQPINLATTFFFSPNDFFAPFAAQAFYRVYKPGVDAVRSDISAGELSGLSLIAVLGYQQQAGSDSGWSDAPESSRNSYVARYFINLAGFEWAFLAGKVRRERIVGGSISGELAGWLGVRAEGHRSDGLDDNSARRSRFSLGLEHRWENSLMLQVEQYYHGPGATDTKSYDMSQAYPARRYQALGLSYEFTPLLSGQFSIVRNQVDHSQLYNMNAVYSLSNESELAISLNVPSGKAPEGITVNSEFGNYPKMLHIELRAYF